MPAIPVTLEVEMGGLWFKAIPGKKVCKTPSQTNCIILATQEAGGRTACRGWLDEKYETLSEI
jgi:hypothetical protein